MQLPVALIIEPPTRAELAALTRSRTFWLAVVVALAYLGAGVWWLARTREARLRDAVPLAVTSEPSGAAVVVDGREEGRTPTTLRVPPGGHLVALRLPGFFDVPRRVEVGSEGATLAARLWRGEATILRLRPTLPGATLAGVGFLADGRVSLTLTLPGDEQQLWLLGGEGGPQRVGPATARAGLALSPDGHRVAYVAAGSATEPAEVRVADGDGGAVLWRLPAGSGERLAELAWAPDATHLLVVSRQQAFGGRARTRLRLLDSRGGEPTDLVTLPSDVVPGSFLWSPDGVRVAFLARAGGLTSLCVVGVDGSIRSVADVARDELAAPLPMPPLAWTDRSDRVLFAATPERPAARSQGWWPLGGGGSGAGPSLLAATLAGSEPPRPLGDASGFAPTVRPDGGIVALARAKSDGRLVLRAVTPDGHAEDVAELPIKVGTALAARWDTAHDQVIVATRGSSGTAEYWLVRFGPAVEAAR